MLDEPVRRRLIPHLVPILMAVSCLAALSIMPVRVLRKRWAFILGRSEADVAAPLARAAVR